MPSNWFLFYKLSAANSQYNALKAYSNQVGSFSIFSKHLVIPLY